MRKIEEAAKSALESSLLVIAARILTLIGIPLVLLWVAAANGAMVDLGKRMAVVEAERASGRLVIGQRLDRLESSDTRDRQVMSDMQSTLSGVVATSQAILREIETMRREAILREQRAR